MIRLGLCCIFLEAPIKFSTTTATAISKLNRLDALAKLSRLALANAEALYQALQYCQRHTIYSFRINSQILPLKTHPIQGYSLSDLPDYEAIYATFVKCGEFVRHNKMRTTFHPDQFVVLNSPRAEVVQASLEEIEYQAEVAAWVEADVINIHAGGVYGDKAKALDDFERNLERLSPLARKRITLENDDKCYTPADLLPLCRRASIPLVYDVHHHRCNRDDLTVAEATAKAFLTWDQEPLFHISSPIEGWDGPRPERHHDYIAINDFPQEWMDRDLTVEVEAKAKEKAIQKLISELPSGVLRAS